MNIGWKFTIASVGFVVSIIFLVNHIYYGDLELLGFSAGATLFFSGMLVGADKK